MKYPNFFTDIKIILKDPLADILGVFENGIIEYSYLDIVKFSGHSCPTVAGAFLMTKIGLQNLYQNNIPIRGDIKVEIKNKKDNGITGVIANIVTFITGASDNGGFKGLNGNFARDNLISFDNEFNGIIKLINGIVPLDNVGGVVSIVQVTSEATDIGIVALFTLTALISVNLGILNLLPIPALDGGHIIFNIYEVIFNKPPNENIMYKLTLFGWVVLLGLMFFGLYNDIVRIISN